MIDNFCLKKFDLATGQFVPGYARAIHKFKNIYRFCISHDESFIVLGNYQEENGVMLFLCRVVRIDSVDQLFDL